jgi:hypothetical protein
LAKYAYGLLQVEQTSQDGIKKHCLLWVLVQNGCPLLSFFPLSSTGKNKIIFLWLFMSGNAFRVRHA